jgi:transposase-like protein
MPKKSKNTKPIKSPKTAPAPSCPYCGGGEATKAGKRQNRSGVVQLYLCNHCARKFRDHAIHGTLSTTYPVPAIIETLSLYDRGYTLDESARRAGKHHRVSISKQLAGTWKTRYARLFPYQKIRDKVASDYPPHTLIVTARFHHGQVYDFAYHRGKMAHALASNDASSENSRAFRPLKTFLEQAPTETPHALFRSQEARASQTKQRFSLDEVAIFERKNSAVEMAQFVIPTVSRNTLRHPKLQDFMLTNDLATIAIEVPVYLTHKDTEHFSKKLGFTLPFALERGATITGHIDLLQIRGGMIHILDYKPGAKREKPIEQLMIYALALSRRTGLRLYHFKCAWFDDEHYYEFYPLHVVHKKKRAR